MPTQQQTQELDRRITQLNGNITSAETELAIIDRDIQSTTQALNRLGIRNLANVQHTLQTVKNKIDRHNRNVADALQEAEDILAQYDNTLNQRGEQEDEWPNDEEEEAQGRANLDHDIPFKE